MTTAAEANNVCVLVGGIIHKGGVLEAGKCVCEYLRILMRPKLWWLNQTIFKTAALVRRTLMPIMHMQFWLNRKASEYIVYHGLFPLQHQKATQTLRGHNIMLGVLTYLIIKLDLMYLYSIYYVQRLQC